MGTNIHALRRCAWLLIFTGTVSQKRISERTVQPCWSSSSSSTFDGHEQIQSQCSDGVVERVGRGGQTGRMVQVHVTKELMETLFFGPLESVLFENLSRCVRLMNPLLLDLPRS